MCKHVIRECPKYEEHRDILKKVDEEMEMENLLGTKKSIEAMGKFLAKSRAFTSTGALRPENMLRPTIEKDKDEENDEEY
ncbi:hypothetical protein J132_04472 [Termitomyces sp. J132]|nr:hypothetical protein J132_04472 [Termitomyces sp. J132]